MADAGLRKKRATSFEQKVVNFLKEMEFSDVDGARDDFRIGGHQIDAIGGRERALFVIECTMAERHGPKCLRQKITNFRGKAHEIEVNVLKDPKYKDHYAAVYFVLATKDIEMLKVDVKYAKQDDELERVAIDLWDENHMDYYIDLKKKIQEWALYDFYGDLKLIGSEEDPIRVPAMRTKLGDEITMYQFTINPQKLKKVAYVARRGISNKSYYQREIKKDKINKITKYINKKGNLLPNNIILSFDDWATKHVKFHKPYSIEGFTDWYNDKKPNTGDNTEFGILQFPAAYKCCWIIDGQHRFYGFKDADRSLTVPVCVISGLNLETQSSIFLDINKFQTAIPPSLQLDLNGLLFPTTEDGRISNTAKLLNAEGACQGIINIPSMIPIGKGTGLKKLPALCTAIKDLKLVTPELRTNKSANPFYDRENPDNTPTLLAKALNGFFNVMEDVFPEDFSRLQKGFVLGDGSGIVMLRIFENIVAYSISQRKKTSIEMIKSCLAPIKSDIEQITISDKLLSDAKGACGNKTGQTKYYENFVRTIRKGIGDDTFGGKLDIATERDYLDAEANAKALLQAVFEPKYGKMWFQEIATKSEYGDARANRKQDRDDSKLHLHIGLGHCTQIIERRIDDFKEVFMSGPEPFESVDMIRIGLKKIRQYKNIASHRTESFSSIDAQHTELYLRQFNACIHSFTQKIVHAMAEKKKDDLKNKINDLMESAESPEGFESKN